MLANVLLRERLYRVGLICGGALKGNIFFSNLHLHLHFTTSNIGVLSVTLELHSPTILFVKGVFKGEVQGVQTPPEIFRFFFEK